MKKTPSKKIVSKILPRKELVCKWLIPCAAASIDKDNNLLSLANIIDEITLTPPPNEKPTPDKPVFLSKPLDVIVMWEREDDIEGPIELGVSLQYLEPGGKVLMEADGAVKMDKRHMRFRNRFQLNGLPYTGPGVYRFRAVSKDERKTSKKIVCESKLEVKVNTDKSSQK